MYNVGSGAGTSMIEMARLVVTIVGSGGLSHTKIDEALDRVRTIAKQQAIDPRPVSVGQIRAIEEVQRAHHPRVTIEPVA